VSRYIDIKIVQAVMLKPLLVGPAWLFLYLAKVKLCFRDMAKWRGLDNIEQL
jgi:hypothetical protein